MSFLHPAFTVITVLLIMYSFLEVNNDKRYRYGWAIVSAMIVLVGLRLGVGADYGAYEQMYYYFGVNTPYETIWDRAMFGEEPLDVEWLYVLLGKIFFGFTSPFYIFTFIVAIISLSTKYISFEDSLVYPGLGLLLYTFPSYFSADGGQMRQGLAMGIILMSFIFIKKRQLLPFLFMIYIAMGFHKSAFIFLFAYWLVLYPFKKWQILTIIIICAILSPFDLYKYISLLESIAPAEVYEGFQAYETIEEANQGAVKLTDLFCIIYTYFLVTYDKEACEKIPYYEYMRNIGVIGICMYFIFRGSPIFSSRLTAYYIVFMTFVLPSIVAAVSDIRLKRSLHLFLVLFVVFYYFVYAKMQAPGAGYNLERYHNLLW